MKRFVQLGLAVVLFGLLAKTSAHAADAARDEARLRGAIAPALVARVKVVLDRARAQGLPTTPLVGRALEGASRQVGDDEIFDAVVRQAAALAEARTAFGDGASPVDLEAGAEARLAGVPADSLGRMRSVAPGRALAVPLVVTCDLVARGVAAETAAGSLISALRARAGDAALMRMRERVHERIRDGAAPVLAVHDGLHELLRRGGAR